MTQSTLIFRKNRYYVLASKEHQQLVAEGNELLNRSFYSNSGQYWSSRLFWYDTLTKRKAPANLTDQTVESSVKSPDSPSLYKEYVAFNDPYKLWNAHTCSTGFLLGGLIRELVALDEYWLLKQVNGKETIVDWSITEHIRDRLFAIHKKMTNPKFYTRSYQSFEDGIQQLTNGVMVGPVATALLVYGFLSAGFGMMCALLCFPSCLYFLKGISCLVKASSEYTSSRESQESSLRVRMLVSQALACFSIGLLLPFFLVITFPLEATRLVSRSYHSIVDAIETLNPNKIFS